MYAADLLLPNVYFVQQSRHILHWNDQTGAVPNNFIPSLMLDVYFAASHFPVIFVKWSQKKAAKQQKQSYFLHHHHPDLRMTEECQGSSCLDEEASKSCSPLSPSNFKNSRLCLLISRRKLTVHPRGMVAVVPLLKTKRNSGVGCEILKWQPPR